MNRFPKAKLEKTVSFEEQIMFKDKRILKSFGGYF